MINWDLDYKVIDMHTHMGAWAYMYSPDKDADGMVRSMDDSNVDFIGHPFGEGHRWERSGDIENWNWGLIPENFIEDVLRCARESGKALEINRPRFEDPVYLDFLKRIRDDKIFFEVGSDAHRANEAHTASVDRTKKLDELGFKEEYHWRAVK